VLLPPEDRDSVISCFGKYGLTPSEELISLYGCISGMEEMDNNHFRMWSLNEIIGENYEPGDLKYFKTRGVMFAYYLVSCWCFWVLPMSSKEDSVRMDYDGKKPDIRGNNLSGFFELMLNDPDEALL